MNNYPITHHIIVANGGRPHHKDWTQIFHSRLKRECCCCSCCCVLFFSQGDKLSRSTSGLNNHSIIRSTLACVGGRFFIFVQCLFSFVVCKVRDTTSRKLNWGRNEGGGGQGRKQFDLAHSRINTNQKRKSHTKKDRQLRQLVELQL